MYKRPSCDSERDLIVKPECNPINNINNQITVFTKEQERCMPPACCCATGELIRNGGFEIPGFTDGVPFADWTSQAAPESLVVRTNTNVFQGCYAASIETNVIQEPVTRSVRLFQPVIVTPGCLYRLTFAEKLITPGTIDTALPTLIAKVIYVYQASAFDLLTHTVQKSRADAKYNLHIAAAKIPVPCNISGVIVRFEFYLPGFGGAVWNLDAVSLRAISKTSACCCKG